MNPQNGDFELIRSKEQSLPFINAKQCSQRPPDVRVYMNVCVNRTLPFEMVYPQRRVNEQNLVLVRGAGANMDKIINDVVMMCGMFRSKPVEMKVYRDFPETRAYRRGASNIKFYVIQYPWNAVHRDFVKYRFRI